MSVHPNIDVGTSQVHAIFGMDPCRSAFCGTVAGMTTRPRLVTGSVLHPLLSLVGVILVAMSASGSGKDNSWFRESADEFTDEVEFSFSIASEGLLQSTGVEGAMLFFVCSPHARWVPPLELPDGRVAGRERLEGFRAWFAFVGDAGRSVQPFRRPDWMAEVVGDGFDVSIRLRFDGDPIWRVLGVDAKRRRRARVCSR